MEGITEVEFFVFSVTTGAVMMFVSTRDVAPLKRASLCAFAGIVLWLALLAISLRMA